ncbi:MAG: hypothetical protein R3212_04100 [Xanthomonadales bacterium]|nr:hypothetical protein [Xanthomonadales bacterium]
MPCFACCQGWMTAEVLGNELKAGQGCPHASEKGCGVYSIRPEVPCRSFVCSWLVEGSPLPDWMRPDQCGAIVLLSLPWEEELVISAVPVGKAIPERTMNWLKDYAQAHKRPLMFYERTVDDEGRYTGLKRFGFGPPAFRAKVARLTGEARSSEVPMKS